MLDSPSFDDSPYDAAEILSDDELHAGMAAIRAQQRFPFAVVAGIATAVLAAFAWGWVTAATHFMSGWSAAAAGALIGIAIRYAGRGVDTRFGVLGGACALFACILGHYLSLIGIVAATAEIPFFDALSQVGLSALPDALAANFEAIDLFIYAAGIVTAFTVSFRKITDQDIRREAARAELEADPAFTSPRGA